MSDDLVKRLRGGIVQRVDSARAADRIENLKEKLSLCIRAIEAQDALKGRITKLEDALLNIFDHESRRHGSETFIACTAKEAIWPEKTGDTV